MEIALLAFTLLTVVALAAYAVVVQPRAQASRNEAERAQMLEELELRRIADEHTRKAHEQALENRLLEAQSKMVDRQAETFLKLATPQLKQVSDANDQALKERQNEIDKGLDGLRKELENVRQYVTKTDNERVRSIGEVANMVKESRTVTEALRQDTSKLSEALAGGQSRGQWGEHIADDVLRIAGFIEGVNYLRQQTTEQGNRPDFTFLLPDERTLHMDVKMPMAAFTRYLDASTDSDRDTAAKEFVRDARQRIKEVTSRDYINPDEGTLDYTLVFIPNEQVYGFIHERDPAIVEFALKQHVVICSPLTLFAVLAVIRQSLENFRLESRTNEIQTAIVKFRRQWDMYREQTEKIGKSIGQLGDRWHELERKRTDQLDKSIDRVDQLRRGQDEDRSLAPAVHDVEGELLGLTTGQVRIAPAEEDEEPLF